MADIEHSTEVDDLGKSYLPESHSLATDRGKQAQTVVDSPDETVTLPDGTKAKWKDKTDRADLKGFDTKRAPKTSEKATRRLLYDQGVGYIEQEPDRFLRGDQASFKLLSRFRDEILDYQSFKQTMKKAWGGDTSLNKLIDGKFTKESDFRSLFEQDVVQSWLNQNIENIAIPVLQRKLNIEEGRARQVWAKLPTRKRGALLTRIQSGKKLVIRRKRGTVRPTLRAGKVMLLTQKRGTTEYKRQFPVRWTDMQENFVRNNRQRGLKWVTEYYNRIFPDERTKGSVQNKLYRLRRG